MFNIAIEILKKIHFDSALQIISISHLNQISLNFGISSEY